SPPVCVGDCTDVHAEVLGGVLVVGVRVRGEEAAQLGAADARLTAWRRSPGPRPAARLLRPPPEAGAGDAPPVPAGRQPVGADLRYPHWFTIFSASASVRPQPPSLASGSPSPHSGTRANWRSSSASIAAASSSGTQ